MYLKKLKNNNRGADIALIGTNYILVLILIVCAIVDLMIIEYGKITVVSVLKECEMYSLAKHYNHDWMWYNQSAEVRNEISRDVMSTCKDAFNGSIAGDNSYMTNCHIITNGASVDGSGIFVGFSESQKSIILTIPQVVFTPKKIFKNTGGSLLPFIGQGLGNMPETKNLLSKQVHAVSVNGSDVIYTGSAMKIAFIPQ